MQPNLRRRASVALIIALGIFTLDQLTKWAIAFQVMNPPRVIPVTSFFNIVMAWNPGVSFSLFEAGSELQVWLLILFALCIMTFLFIWLLRTKGPLLLWAISFIIGGALGNIVDRARFGAVIDFLDFHAYGWHWPAFNVADSAICIGVGLILLDNFMGKDRED